MKNKNLIGIIILVLLFNWNYGSSQNYFEGEMYFHIDYELIDNKISKNNLIKQMGDSVVAYLKEDKFVLLHNSKGKLGKRKTIFLLNEGFNYVDYEKSDTIMRFNLNKISGKLLNFNRNLHENKPILNELCESITIEFESTNKEDFFQKHKGKYYFSANNYKLNPKYYRNYESNFWNLFVKESTSISLRNEVEYYPLFKSIQQVYGTIKRKIPDSVFQLNKNKYIKIMK